LFFGIHRRANFIFENKKQSERFERARNVQNIFANSQSYKVFAQQPNNSPRHKTGEFFDQKGIEQRSDKTVRFWLVGAIDGRNAEASDDVRDL
jgi:hypothetical protein